MEKQARNLFFTKHFWSVIGVFYISSLSPAIDKFIDGSLNKIETEHLFNATIATVFAASVKTLEDDIYTPHYILGKNKEDIISKVIPMPEQQVQPSVEQQVLNVGTTVEKIAEQPVETAVDSITQDPTLRTVATVADDIINPTNLIGQVGKSSGDSSTYEQNTAGLYIQANKKTWYKTSPVDSSILADNQKISIAEGQIVNIIAYEEPVHKHIKITYTTGNIYYAFQDDVTIYKDKQPISFSTGLIPTIDQLGDIYGNSLSQAQYTDFLNCIHTFNISTPEDICEFIAQTGHESAGLQYTKELATGEDYEFDADLGNNQVGDGSKYKGGGFIQLTGRANYQALADYLNDPKVMDGVDYVAANYAFTSAGFWWYNNNISDAINNKGADIYAVTQRVNGGQNGIDDRIAYYQKAKEVFGLN